MTALRWMSVAWFVAFLGGAVVAWYISGLTVPEHDARARVAAEYAAEISTTRSMRNSDPAVTPPLSTEGIGPMRVGAIQLGRDELVIRASYRGSGAFRVEARSTASEQRWILIDRTDTWQGTVVFTPPMPGTFDFLVDAIGGWSLEIDTVPQ